MTDEEKVTETEQEVQGEQASPTPSVPSVASAPDSSGPDFNADQFVSALSDPRVRAAAVEALRPEWTKDDQSTKDVRIQGLTDDVDTLKQYLTASGGNVDQAVREMRIDAILEGNAPPAGGTAGGNETNQAFMEARTAQLLGDAGVDFEDPDYKMLVAQYGGRVTDPNQWLAVVEGFTATRTTNRAKQENIPGAAAASEGGNVLGTGGDEDIETLTAQLAKLQAQPATAETMAQRSELRKRLTAEQDRLGLLDNVTFTRE